MYTGIIQATGQVKTIKRQPGLLDLTINCPAGFNRNLETGASVAVDGCCLTVVNFTESTIGFNVMAQTMDTTTLGSLAEGDLVNLERSLKVGDELGGHILSGHIYGTTEIVNIQQPENNFILTCKLPKQFAKYFFEKGFIGLHGASLTLASVDQAAGEFTVYLIPETLQRTTFGEKSIGDRLNIEIDSQTQTIVETVERLQKT